MRTNVNIIIGNIDLRNNYVKTVASQARQSGPVLYIGLNHYTRPAYAWGRSTTVFDSWPRINLGGLAAIVDWLQSNPSAGLAVIDDLRLFEPQHGNLQKKAYMVLHGLDRIAARYKVPFLVLGNLPNYRRRTLSLLRAKTAAEADGCKVAVNFLSSPVMPGERIIKL